MRIMGLDVGEKRIGIAFSDELGWTAQGHSVLVRSNLQQDLQHLAGLCANYGVGEVVVGFPRNMNGTVGPKGVEILEFGELLQNNLGLPVEYWDERLTTVAAQGCYWKLISPDASASR